MNISKEQRISDMDPTSYFVKALKDMNISTDRSSELTSASIRRHPLCGDVNISSRSMMTTATTSTRTDSDDSSCTDFNFHNSPVINVGRLVEFDNESTNSILIHTDDYLESSSELYWDHRKKIVRQHAKHLELIVPDVDPSDQEMQKLRDELERLQEEDFQLKLVENQLELEFNNLQLVFEEAASVARRRRLAIQKAKLERIREDSTYDLGYYDDK